MEVLGDKISILSEQFTSGCRSILTLYSPMVLILLPSLTDFFSIFRLFSLRKETISDTPQNHKAHHFL